MAAHELDDANYIRDPKKLNDHTFLEFDDVIGEPPSLLSTDGVWDKSVRTFNFSKDLSYLILTSLCGIPTACLCGVKFAALSFSSIWCVTPCVKSCQLCLSSARVGYSTFVRCMCDPFWQSIGNLFGGIRISKGDV